MSSHSDGNAGSGSDLEMCALCEQDRRLCRSHVLPEFLYRPLYDAEHKAHRFSPDAPENARTLQTGVWERLLCLECEARLNDEYEKPFLADWYQGSRTVPGALTPFYNTRVAVLRVPRPEAFALFHASVLFRAGVAKRGEFACVQLGHRHETRLRNVLLGRTRPSVQDYPIVCYAIERLDGPGVLHDVVSSPIPFVLDGLRGYALSFAGCTWLYFAVSHTTPLLEKIRFKADGDLPIMRGEWPQMREWRRQWRVRHGLPI